MDLREYFANRDMVGMQESQLTDRIDGEKFRQTDKSIAVLTIDDNVISGYGSYSFVRVKEYIKEPTRSQDGQIANLDSYTTFITPKVRVKFNALSIDGYRMLMDLILSKNEFYVGCYDFVADRWVHQNMYFYPNDYPEIFQYDLEVLAAINYEIELIGTNTNNENIVVTLHSNYPNTADNEQVNYTIANTYQNEPVVVSYPSNFAADKEITIDNVAYAFVGWNQKADGSGVTKLDGSELTFGGDTDLYAMWDSGTDTVHFNIMMYADVSPSTQEIGYQLLDADQEFLNNDVFSKDNTPQFKDTAYWKFTGWFKNPIELFKNMASFPASGANNKVYFALDTNKAYIWANSQYTELDANSTEYIYGQHPNGLTYDSTNEQYLAYGVFSREHQ